MPFRFGPWEIGLILVVILFVFGVGKLPQVGGAMGKGLREFRKARSGIDDITRLNDDTPGSRKANKS